MSVFLSADGQAGGGVDAGGQFLIKQIDILGIFTQELHFVDQGLGIGFLLALFLDKPTLCFGCVNVLHQYEKVFQFIDFLSIRA